MAGRAVAVTLPAGVGLRVPVAEPLERGSHLRLAADRREDQHPLAGVYQVGEVPDVLGPADRPRDHVRYPCNAHHDHQLHAYAAQRCPGGKKGGEQFIYLRASTHVDTFFMIPWSELPPKRADTRYE